MGMEFGHRGMPRGRTVWGDMKTVSCEDWSDTAISQGTFGAPETGGGKEGSPSSTGFRGGMAPLTPQFQTFSLYICDTVHFCCSGPLGLWWFRYGSPRKLTGHLLSFKFQWFCFCFFFKKKQNFQKCNVTFFKSISGYYTVSCSCILAWDLWCI